MSVKTHTAFKTNVLTVDGTPTEVEFRGPDGRKITEPGPLFGIPAATGTAVLVAGTKVVTDPKITANSVIRLSNKTLGGTPGAVYVSAKTASTSFAITSTSNTDTSTVYYEILSY